jgi:hypothetical protein
MTSNLAKSMYNAKEVRREPMANPASITAAPTRE